MTTDEERAGLWFTSITKPQLARYNARLAAAAPYRNSPRWDRERERANKAFEYETADARRLYEMAMNDLAVLGEISEATAWAFDDASLRQTTGVAA